MTDPHTFDELASAHLDGATSAEEAAMVAADPALQARVDELRAVRAALAEPPATDAAAREAAIAAALAAFAEQAQPTRPTATVTPMAERRGLSPRTIRVLGAAAVVALLALLVPLLASIDQGADEVSFNSTGDAISGAGTDGGVEEAPATTTGEVADTASDADIGSNADLDALAAAVDQGALDGRATPDLQEGDDTNPESFCPPPEGAGASGYAVVAGERVLVLVVSAPDGARTMTVLSPDGCQILDEREL